MLKCWRWVLCALLLLGGSHRRRSEPLPEADCRPEVSWLSTTVEGEKLCTRFAVRFDGSAPRGRVFFEYWIRYTRSDRTEAWERGIFRRWLEGPEAIVEREDLPLFPALSVEEVAIGKVRCSTTPAP